jgi:hypothetical protein
MLFDEQVNQGGDEFLVGGVMFFQGKRLKFRPLVAQCCATSCQLAFGSIDAGGVERYPQVCPQISVQLIAKSAAVDKVAFQKM